jgi:uncharacterized protein YdhG (YjbR/CyaY superfamily)
MIAIDVDEYIAKAPKEMQGRLNDLREAIKSAAPEALEKISYRMPYYHFKGRLVYFQLWKDHIGVYALTTPVLEKFKYKLKDKITGKGTIRFSLEEKLPLALIKRMVKAQYILNDKAKKK